MIVSLIHVYVCIRMFIYNVHDVQQIHVYIYTYIYTYIYIYEYFYWFTRYWSPIDKALTFVLHHWSLTGHHGHRSSKRHLRWSRPVSPTKRGCFHAFGTISSGWSLCQPWENTYRISMKHSYFLSLYLWKLCVLRPYSCHSDSPIWTSHT